VQHKENGVGTVIDYTQEDFTQKEQRYDLILDIVANRSVSDYSRALTPKGTYVAVAFNPSALFLGSLISMTGNKKMNQLSHKPNVKDLVFIKELIEAGKVIPIIARRYPLREAAEALRYYEEGHPSGKVIITVEHDSK
jgi:NADPH:quinone reductase-like Zn-dependent oxidoreductase